MCTAYYGVLPPCISGRVVTQLAGGQVEMECVPYNDVPHEQLVSATSDDQLVQRLSRAVLSFIVDGSSYHEVECLTPFVLAGLQRRCRLPTLSWSASSAERNPVLLSA